MQDLEKMIADFRNIVSPKFCNELAKKSGLVKRSSSQLQGYEFAQALLIPNGFLGSETLNSLAVRMNKINNNCNLSAPALCQRMNSTMAVIFMKACFDKVLTTFVKKDFVSLGDLQNFSCFKRILIQDSTVIELQHGFSPGFKGYKGTSKSNLKIDYIFDYLSEQTVDLSIFSANQADQSLAARINFYLEKGDLVIRDLGYFAVERFKEIEAKCYHISRLKTDVNIYENMDDIEPIDLVEFFKKHSVKSLIDVKIFVGKEKHAMRLVASSICKKTIAQKLKKAKRRSQRNGTAISEKKLNLLQFNICLTNVPKSMLSCSAIMVIYRARWRIENIIKQWKSCLGVHIFNGYKEKSLECLIYGRLIVILLIHSISTPLMQYAITLNKELSCFKLFKYMVADNAFKKAFDEFKIAEFIKILLLDLPKRLCMDERKRYSLRKNVRTNTCFPKSKKMNNLSKKFA